jgi:carbazole 1,9a-dioxygenase
MTMAEWVAPEILERVRVGRNYVRAKYGFRNHWYPVRLSTDIREGEPVAVTVLGEHLLLNRVDGQVFALRDQCLHRGVALSRKPECYRAGTITCWYHGFTYRFSDGLLVDIVGTQSSNVIGRKRLRAFPVIEAKGLVFVFVGDPDFTPPPLVEDVPPGFLDADLHVRGQWQEVGANWRVGAENGFDSTHIFIHKDSVLIGEADLALPLGLQPRSRAGFVRQAEPGGPVGVFDNFGPEHIIPVFEGTIEGETVLTGAVGGSNIVPHTISMWLPCALRVQPWPVPELTQYEWYVPIDGQRHIYLQTLARSCTDAAQRAAFDAEFEQRWVPAALNGFNDDDVWAREATQPFYADDTGWLKEQLFEPDGNIVEWRKLASEHARGIQLREHIDPPRG